MPTLRCRRSGAFGVGVLEDNEEIYPSIQNVWLGTLGRADEVIAVEGGDE